MKRMIRIGLSAGALLSSLLPLATACGEDEAREHEHEHVDSGSNDAARETSTDARADAPNDARDDGDCDENQRWYNQAGCDGAVPVCVQSMDACASTFCDCEGRTISSGCGFSEVPFSRFGACVVEGGSDSGDAGADANGG
ncbi:MAG TPA: hypothetical protein VK524_34175 [Polyangiaceae bacterium]|nr:hypothetical protein [Polyangiaceae bacterium]